MELIDWVDWTSTTENFVMLKINDFKTTGLMNNALTKQI